MLSNLIQWLDERTGIPFLWSKVVQWTVPSGRGSFRFLPTMIIFAFLLQAISGVFLWAYYSPSAQTAWESLFYMQFVLPGGWLIRGIHHFSAQVLVALCGIYFVLLVLRGGYRSPREFVFWSAVGLLLLSLGLSLTGDLLSWTLSGYSATLVRVRFLQMLPLVGDSLFKIVAGGPEFGTLTLPRFLVLHILVCGGGFFAVMLLWRYFDHRADQLVYDEMQQSAEESKKPKKPVRLIPFWTQEVLKCSLACLLVSIVVLFLVYQKPIIGSIRPDLDRVDTSLPREASLGVHTGAPADPGGFYDAARPEWSFRALYHFSNLKTNDGTDVFPGTRKYLPIFVIPSCLALYVFLIPVIGQFKLGRAAVGHYFNVLAVLFLFGGFCWLTYASYAHDYLDPTMQRFRDDEASAENLAKRSIELCLDSSGNPRIPPTGALTLLQRDPLLQGPALFERHCLSCHPFDPLGDGNAEERPHPDFKPMVCEKPSAPNLYRPIRKDWIAGFLDSKKIRSDDYFGKTKFSPKGRMVGWVQDTLSQIIKEDPEENEKMLDELIAFLADEALKDGPRKEDEPLTKEQAELFPSFDCGQCHHVYGARTVPAIQAPDLRGYLSREWLIGIIADPTSKRFYGPDLDKTKGNDRMPSFHRSKDDATMSMDEIEILADWLRGTWHRRVKAAAAPLQSLKAGSDLPPENVSQNVPTPPPLNEPTPKIP